VALAAGVVLFVPVCSQQPAPGWAGGLGCPYPLKSWLPARRQRMFVLQMVWARFLYGVAFGLTGGWLVLTYLQPTDLRWLLVAAAACLATALVLHQRSVRLSRGRRWHKSVS